MLRMSALSEVAEILNELSSDHKLVGGYDRFLG